MNAADLMGALIQAGDADGYNIDEHCYFYALATGMPCPPPEDFGAGDRSARYSVAAFAGLAATGFDSAGNQPGQGSAPGLTAPVVGSNGNGATTGGGLFGGGIVPLIIIGAIVYFLFFED